MKKDFNFYVVEFPEEYAMCILGKRIPSLIEADQFLESEKYNLGKAIEVYEVDEDEAMTFYDMDNMDNFPIFE